MFILMHFLHVISSFANSSNRILRFRNIKIYFSASQSVLFKRNSSFFIITVVSMIIGYSPSIGYAAPTTNNDSLGSSLLIKSAEMNQSGNSGSAIKSIPIEVPPGINGIEPNIVLSYNSSSKNGWVGVGWNLDMGSIRRSTKRGVNYAGDEYVAMVNGSVSELIYIGNTLDGGRQYRALIEGAFMKYVKYGDDYWTVTDKRGTVYTFGGTPENRLARPGGGIFEWMLSRIEDIHGNYMTLSYWADENSDPAQSNNRIYLSEIKYTGNTVTGKTPSTTVTFHSEGGRTDTFPSHNSQIKIKTAYRLKTIEIAVNNDTIREYKLEYDLDPDSSGSQYSTSTSNSLLTSVQVFGKGSSLPKTEFTWQHEYAWDFYPKGDDLLPTHLVDDGNLYFGDWNGDGLTDVVWHRASDGKNRWYINNGDMQFPLAGTDLMTPAEVDGGNLHLGDWNGDGLTDVMWYRNVDGHTRWFLSHMNNGQLELTDNANPISTGDIDEGRGLYFGDWNGDGLTDVMWYSSATGRNRWYMTEIINGEVQFPTNKFDPIPTAQFDDGNIHMGDWNSDGITDVVWHRYSDGDNRWHINDGSLQFAETVNPMTPAEVDDGHLYFGDWNGDGLTDAMWYRKSDGDNRWFINKIQDNNIQFDNEWNPIESKQIDNGTGIYFGDWNGDGKTDVMWYRESTGDNVWYTMKDGLDFKHKANPINKEELDNGTGLYFGDWDGNGITDVMWFRRWSGKNTWYKNYNNSPDLLTSINNGMGATTDLTYEPSSSYTNSYLPFIVQTLSSMKIDDGNDVIATTNYVYAGGYFDREDREFRGFEVVETKAPNSTITETNYHTGYDTNYKMYRGLPYEQTVFTIDQSENITLYNSTIYKYYDESEPPPPSAPTPCTGSIKVNTSHINVSYPCLKRKEEQVHDGQTTPLSVEYRYKYDQYGNIAENNFVGENGAGTGDERYEKIIYNHDTTNWILSKPLKKEIVNGDGHTRARTWYAYDGLGRLQREENCLTDFKTSNECPDTEGQGHPKIQYFNYDAYGNAMLIKDAKGHDTNFNYNYATDYLEITSTATTHNGATHQTKKKISFALGKVIEETDSNNNVTSYKYDELGRITKVIGPKDSEALPTMEYHYWDFGTVWNQRVVTHSRIKHGASPVVWKETYFDGLGRDIRTETSGPGQIIRYDKEYNNIGKLKREYIPYFKSDVSTEFYTEYKYDPLGRVIETLLPDKNQTFTAYNKGEITYTDAEDNVKKERMDVFNRLAKVTEYRDGVELFTTYKYDVLGNLTDVRDAADNLTEIEYDSLSRKTDMYDPDMGHWTYEYDLNGNLEKQTDAMPQTIEFAYDELNRVDLKTYPDGSYIDYIYDETGHSHATGRLTTVKKVDSASTVTLADKYHYDESGQIVKTERTIDNNTYITEIEYDSLGRIELMRYPDPQRTEVRYWYDEGGNLIRVSNAADTYNYAVYNNYNALNQVRNVQYANEVTTDYSYDSTNGTFRLTSIVTQNGSSVDLMKLSYDLYDNVGNIKSITDLVDSDRSRTYEYDDLYRLKEATSVMYGGTGSLGTLGYDYDHIGNMIYNCRYGQYKYEPTNKPHALRRIEDNSGNILYSYEYDNNGNMESDSRERSFSYDYDNMPTVINYRFNTIESEYDADGQRVKKTYKKNGLTLSETIYVSDIYECTNDNCTLYVFGDTQRIAMIDNSGTYYFHTDHLGSSSVITDNSGNKVQDLFYYPYGELKVNSGADIANYKYTDQEWDAESGLYYYGARFYDPKLARFISADTIVPDFARPQSLNRYAYALNNPIILVDPSGHESFCYTDDCWLTDEANEPDNFVEDWNNYQYFYSDSYSDSNSSTYKNEYMDWKYTNYSLFDDKSFANTFQSGSSLEYENGVYCLVCSNAGIGYTSMNDGGSDAHMKTMEFVISIPWGRISTRDFIYKFERPLIPFKYLGKGQTRTWGQWLGAGISVGEERLSGETGNVYTHSLGLGRYLGYSRDKINGKKVGEKANLGVALSPSPYTYSVPFCNDCAAKEVWKR